MIDKRKVQKHYALKQSKRALGSLSWLLLLKKVCDIKTNYCEQLCLTFASLILLIHLGKGTILVYDLTICTREITKLSIAGRKL